MKCPKCDENIETVRVYSEAYQVSTLKGSKIDNYGSVQELTETVAIECPICGEDIINYIEQ